MPSTVPATVPLETFLLTLLVPRTISDAKAAAVVKRVRGPAFRRALASVLRTLPTPVTVSITLPH